MIERLQTILNRHLVNIRRWRFVDVSMWKDANHRVKELHKENDKYFYIYWNGTKTNNHNVHEIREIPLCDIEKVIHRYDERLKNGRSVYK
jgi:hypothetical protein